MKQVKIVGRIIKRNGQRPETIVKAERYDSLSFRIMSPSELHKIALASA